MKIRFAAVLLLICAASTVYGLELRLSRFYTDNMVFQRGKPVLVKGFAKPGAKVTLAFADRKKTVTADEDGKWQVSLDPMNASKEPRTLSVTSAGGKQQCSIRNVLVGDVFIFARQSSIDVSLGTDATGERAAARVKAPPMLRVLQIDAAPATTAQDDLDEEMVTAWSEVNSKNALSMSAASFHMALNLVKNVDVPVGIVDIDMGYFFGVSWLSTRTLDESDERYGQGDLSWFRKHMPEAQEKWEQDKAEGKARPGLPPLHLPYYPSACYNTVLYPLQGVAVKGILLQSGNDYPLVTYSLLRKAGKITEHAELNYAWAQGYLVIKHANRMTPATLPFVPSQLRRTFADEKLPIGWIMPPSSDLYDYAVHNREMRELQRRTAKEEENNLDLIMPGNKHVPLSGQPADEKLLAERCASWVIGTFYDDEAASSGPVFERFETGAGGQATVFFKKGTAEGLRAKGDALEQFEVAGSEKRFVPCKAEVDGDSVKLTSDEIYKILWVRYNWNGKPDQGLVNSADLPAVPFNAQKEWSYVWWPPSPPVELPAEYHTTANKWPNRDIAIINGANRLGGGDSQRYPNDLGPTGIKAASFGPNLYVHGSLPGSPADGKVQVGDYIYGVNGDEFGTEKDDKYHQFSAAITRAESRAGEGKLVLNIRRRGKNIDVELELDVLGSYSDSTPYYCPKSERIVERAEAWLAEQARPESGMAREVSGRHGTDLWFLMASGKPEHQGLVRRAIYDLMKKPPREPDPTQKAIPWHIGYRAMLLGEYYHSTGDTNVLPYLESQAGWAAATQLRPQSEPGPQEPAWTEQQVGGYRTRYQPNRPMSKGGYGLMAAAGMPCVMGMVLAKEAGCDVNDVKLERGLKHFYHRRAEYGDVMYWYHPLWRDKPPAVKPDVEARGGLWTQNGKLGTAAALFSIADYPTAVDVCSRICVYSYNNTRHGHGGMFYNNFWTPIGAHVAGERGFKHFMKGQTWWRELYRRHEGSFNQVGRGGIGVGYAIHYVAPKKRLRILGAPKSVFGKNPPEYLKPALEAHSKRDYALAEERINKTLKQRIIPKEEMPVLNHFLESVQVLRKSVEHDLAYTEDLLKQGDYYYASLELPQLKGVVAPDDPRLKAIAEALESTEGRKRVKQNAREIKRRERERKKAEAAARTASAPERKEEWVCLVPRHGTARRGRTKLGLVPEEEAARWKMNVFETRDHVPGKWADPAFDDSGWDEIIFPISWRVSHAALFRTRFKIQDKEDIDALRFRANVFQQQQVDVYLNGKLIAKVNNTRNSVSHVLTDYALDVAQDGENTLAIFAKHHKRWGKVKHGRSNANHVYFTLDAGKIDREK